MTKCLILFHPYNNFIPLIPPTLHSPLMLPIRFIQKRFKYTLPDLPYDYSALEPVISAEIMQIHHQKHHATYVANLNSALERFHSASQAANLPTLVSLQSQIRFNGGGHLNHSIFWRNLCPVRDAKGAPEGRLKEAIEGEFGSFEAFKTHFSTQTAQLQGSGWGWLVSLKERAKESNMIIVFFSYQCIGTQSGY